MHSSIREFFSGTPASNRRELRLHLNVVPTGAGVFKSRHILLHKYVNRIMITYLWRQIQLIIPSRRFRSIECRHFDLFWKYVTWSWTLYKLRLRFYLLVLCVYTFLLIWIIKQQNGLLTTLSIIILLKRLFYNTRFILFSNWCKYVFMPLTKFIQHGNDELLTTTYIWS